jgi:hypothetical protein
MTIRTRTICLMGAVLISIAAPMRASAQGQVAPAPQQTTAPPAFPTFEVTGGYQALHVPDDWVPFGLNVDGAWNFNEALGLVGEIGWATDSEDFEELDIDSRLHLWTFAAGPRWNARPDARLWPFAQVLVGAAHARVGTDIQGEDVEELSGSDTRFMIQPGVGVNINAGDGWGIVGQVDYRRIFLDEEEDGESGENELRLFVGIRLLLD